MSTYDLDNGVMFHIVTGGMKSIKAAEMMGVTSDLLRPPYSAAFATFQSALASGSLLTQNDVEAMFGVALKPTGVPQATLFSEILNRNLFSVISDGHEQVGKLLQENDPNGAYLKWVEQVELAKAAKPKASPPRSLLAQGDEVKTRYTDTEEGKLGLLTRWQTFNEMTMGLVRGTNSWILARPGVGKTQISIIMSHDIWARRFLPKPVLLNVLFVSGEMLGPDLAERFYALHKQFSYGGIVGGKLSPQTKADYFGLIDSYKELPGFYFLDPTDGITPDKIEDAVEACQADLVVIEAVYRMKWIKKQDRLENMTAGVSFVSNLAKRKWSNDRKIAVIATSQLNRSATKKGGWGDASIALSDSVLWEGDNVFFLKQTDDMKADKKLDIEPRKVRRMTKWRNRIPVHWDMEGGHYNERQLDLAKDGFKDTGFKEFGKNAKTDDDGISGYF